MPDSISFRRPTPKRRTLNFAMLICVHVYACSVCRLFYRGLPIELSCQYQIWKHLCMLNLIYLCCILGFELSLMLMFFSTCLCSDCLAWLVLLFVCWSIVMLLDYVSFGVSSMQAHHSSSSCETLLLNQTTPWSFPLHSWVILREAYCDRKPSLNIHCLESVPILHLSLSVSSIYAVESTKSTPCYGFWHMCLHEGLQTCHHVNTVR